MWFEPAQRTIHTADLTTGTGVVTNTQGKYGAVVLQVVSTAGAVTFQGSIDGTNYQNIFGVNITTGALTATPTGAGIFTIPIAGLNYFKAPISTASSSTAGVGVTATAVFLAETVSVVKSS